MRCDCGCWERMARYGDSECRYTLEAEEEMWAEEDAALTLDSIETLAASRFGNAAWFWNKPYVWKAQGYSGDEIPF